jgi:hypothetical protein
MPETPQNALRLKTMILIGLSLTEFGQPCILASYNWTLLQYFQRLIVSNRPYLIFYSLTRIFPSYLNLCLDIYFATSPLVMTSPLFATFVLQYLIRLVSALSLAEPVFQNLNKRVYNGGWPLGTAGFSSTCPAAAPVTCGSSIKNPTNPACCPSGQTCFTNGDEQYCCPSGIAPYYPSLSVPFSNY